ncbi:fibronectin type III domain-containing protein, partial [bacterium]|nr:fibronectin type III domain-containing protein [bacterium]
YSARSTPAVVPRAVPGTPLNFTVAADDKQANLSWDAPANNGDTISDYVVKSCKSTTCTEFAHEASSNTTITVTGLTNGTAYTFKVAAKNAAGVGGEATSGGTPRTVAGAPTGVAGTPGDKKVDLTWSAPVDSGGAAVTDYVVQYCTSKCETFTDAVSSDTKATVTGLTNGTGYTFQVAAVNDAKTGGYSARSSEVTPRTVPGVPTNATAVADNIGGVKIDWSAPTSDGGAAISDYQVTICVATNCTNYGVNISTGNKLTYTVPETPTRTMVGYKWSFLVRAVNVAGAGAQTSLIGPVDPRRVSNAPSNVIATVNNTGGVGVSWTAPSSNGANISDYIVQYCTGGTCTIYDDGVSATASVSVIGLVKGTAYTFKVAAVNAAGQGSYSVPSNEVTPRSVAEAPTNATATANNTGGVVVSWTAPTDNSGAAITDYTVQSCVGGSCTSFAHSPVSIATSQTVTGLTKGSAYTFKVAAVNVAGTSLFANAAAAATPRAVTGEPTDLVGTPGNAQVALTWKAPSATNGSAISNYIVQSCISTTCSVVARDVSATASQIVTSLINGTTYTFKVAAVNEAGTSSYVTSLGYTPRTVPDAPTSVTATADSTGGVAVSWSPPEFNGGSAITDYTVQSCLNTTCSTLVRAASTSTSATVTGLTKGTLYTFQVAAVNIAGTGLFAKAIGSGATPRAVPGTPTNLVGVVGNAQVALTWTAPANNGDEISDYEVKWCLGASCTAFAHTASADTSITVNNLTNGSAYTFQVAAKNAAGTGTAVVSSAYTPRTVPTAPLSVLGTVGNQQVALSWTQPVSNGGAAITDYIVQSCTGGTCATFNDGAGTVTSATVTGLTNGTAYTFQVAAKNIAGDGPYSTASTSITPRTVPDAPTAVTATADNTGGIDVSWSAPSNNGGASITDYTLQSCISSTCTTVSRSPSTDTSTKVAGLVKGTAYTFQVAAVNVAGTGLYSTKSAAATPRAVAGTPIDIVGVVGNTQVVLTWVAPASNGAAITDYVVQACAGSSCSTFAHNASAVAGITVTGLTNGTIYTFKVAAVNLAGTGSAGTSTAYTPRTVPNAPTSVRAVPDNTTGIDVSWTAPAINGGSAITDYVVEYATTNTDYVVFADGVGTGTSVKVTGLTQGVEYIFRVAAKNIAGQGAYSDSGDDAKAVARTKPGKPTASVTSTRDGAVNVEWKFEASQTDGGAEIERFIVEWALFGTENWSSKASDDQTIRLEGLTIGSQYKFRITAENAAGTSEKSVVVVATPHLPPQSPTNLSATVTTDGSVTLSWRAPLDIGGSALTQYYVGFCTGTVEVCKNRSIIKIGSNGILAKTTTFREIAGTYKFYVAAVNDAGLEDCIDLKKVKCGALVSVVIGG